jgi:hypothetical protein
LQTSNDLIIPNKTGVELTSDGDRLGLAVGLRVGLSEGECVGKTEGLVVGEVLGDLRTEKIK